MTEIEFVAKLQEEIKGTIAYSKYEKSLTELMDFLGEYVPDEKATELSRHLQSYSEESAAVQKRMIELAEEMADELE